MERPTTEVVLKTGERVILFEYLSLGETREIQKTILKDQRVDMSSQEINLRDLPISALLEQQDQALRFLLKQVISPEGTVIEEPLAYLLQLRPDIGQVVFNKATEILSSSGLSLEDKKK